MPDTSEKMHVALASDHTYVCHMEACILSILESSKGCGIIFEILDNGLFPDDIIAISEEIKAAEQNVRFHKLDNVAEKMGFLPPLFQNSLGIYCRIFLPQILPDLKKILYLDCDTIVKQPLFQLFDLDVDHYAVAGVIDTMSSMHKESVGLKSSDVYINSGVLIINLDKWREECITEKVIDFIRIHKEEISLPDQDAINVSCAGKIKVLDAKYNVMTPFFVMPYSNIIGYFNVGKFYTKAQIKHAKKNPVIIHFTGYPDNRPWQEGCHHPLRREYFKYARDFDVGGCKTEKNIRKRQIYLRYRYLPYSIYKLLKRMLRG